MSIVVLRIGIHILSPIIKAGKAVALKEDDLGVVAMEREAEVNRRLVQCGRDCNEAIRMWADAAEQCRRRLEECLYAGHE